MTETATTTAPERREIPKEAQEEIMRLFSTLNSAVTQARQATCAFEDARRAFNEFVKATRISLNIANDDRGWYIEDDASAFVRVGPVAQCAEKETAQQ